MSARSLTARLSLLFALSTATMLLVLGTTLDHAVKRHFRDLDRHELSGKLALVREMAAAAPAETVPGDLSARLAAALVGHPGLTVQVRAGDGSLVFARGELPQVVDASRAPLPRAASAERWWEWHGAGRPLRGLSAPLRQPGADAPAGTVQIALDTSHHRAFMDVFRRILALSILMAAAAAAVLGWVATRAGLRPLRRITALASALDTERLDARLPRTGVPAEILTLVTAFNSMLARLEDSFRRLSELAADVAHELRTPIANLTLQTQVALGTRRDAAAYREVLYSSLAEYERLGRMINDMLFLAEAEHGHLRLRAEPVDLAAQVRALFDYFDAWAEDKRVTLALDGDVRVRGNALMLRRALSNLLCNAIRHTDPGHTVRVRLCADAEQARICVENPGPALPAERLQHIFERFYRGSAEPDGNGPGSGLGLAIVKAIVTAHGGAVRVRSAAGVTRFELLLPLA